MSELTIIENEKELTRPLSELCDLQGVEYAAYLLFKHGNEPFISLLMDEQVSNIHTGGYSGEVPFEIASMTIPEAVAKHGAELTLRYIYDWAEHEIENLDEDSNFDSTNLDEEQDELYCQLNLFRDKVYQNGGYESED